MKTKEKESVQLEAGGGRKPRVQYRQGIVVCS